MEKKVYTAKEVAAVLGSCLCTVRQLCHRPDFPAIRVSPRRIVIPVDGLNRWLEKNAAQSI